jgi:hypothetical protein
MRRAARKTQLTADRGAIHKAPLIYRVHSFLHRITDAIYGCMPLPDRSHQVALALTFRPSLVMAPTHWKIGLTTADDELQAVVRLKVGTRKTKRIEI